MFVRVYIDVFNRYICILYSRSITSNRFAFLWKILKHEDIYIYIRRYILRDGFLLKCANVFMYLLNFTALFEIWLNIRVESFREEFSVKSKIKNFIGNLQFLCNRRNPR